ncbi:kelch-like protein 22 isoform X4 [Ornithorhynchus anatinus]|uniref:Kelch-like protein 22 n=1 Tax=Ornithorhynchus anatinus TaxID=9258 RepID=A0A6I8NGK8_ORNAN|nr:kelch-like protein 22 isoform X4 [Ornithorhynchus anatinus]
MAEDRGPTPQFKRPAESPPPPDTSSTYRSARHSQALLGGLVALRDSGTLFDVVLVVEGKPIEAHRLLLAASCDYFRGMFAGGLREVKQEEVPIHGVSHSAMCKILNFIYTSELELSLADVQETLAAACQLQIPEVIGFCCDFLLAWVDEENILDVYRLAGLFHLAHLADQLDAYVLGHFPAFCRSPAYRRLPPDKVRSLLGSDRLRVDSEREVLTGVLLYHFPPEVADAGRVPPAVPPDLLDAVRFPLMDLASLRGLRAQLEPGPLRDRVAGALAYHRDEGLQPVRQSAQTELRSRRRCVVGFGGKHSTVLSNHARYLDPRAQEWRRLAASLGPLMSNQGVAVLNNFAFLVGGDNDVRGFHAEARCWRYDPRHNQWFQIQPLQRAHADLCVCVVGRFIYAIAGRDYHTDLKEVERYDPATDTWQYVAPLKGEVYAHAGATLDGKVFITCGRRGEAYLKELHCYHPEGNFWEQLADGPVNRAWHGMAALLGRLYVIGGSNDDAGYRRDVHQVACFNPSTGQWTSVHPLPAGHGEPGIAVLDNRIYVLGGRSHNRGICMDYVHVYDAEKDRWEEGPPLEMDISGLAACVLTLPRTIPNGTNLRNPEWHLECEEDDPQDSVADMASFPDSD